MRIELPTETTLGCYLDLVCSSRGVYDVLSFAMSCELDTVSPSESKCYLTPLDAFGVAPFISGSLRKAPVASSRVCSSMNIHVGVCQVSRNATGESVWAFASLLCFFCPSPPESSNKIRTETQLARIESKQQNLATFWLEALSSRPAQELWRHPQPGGFTNFINFPVSQFILETSIAIYITLWQ